MNNIVCKICGQSFQHSRLFFHHLKSTHKADKLKYVAENFSDFIPFGWKECEECRTLYHGGTSAKCGSCFSKNHKRNEDQYIVCRYCNKLVHSKTMPQHLRLSHLENFHTYVEKNLDDFRKFGWIECTICGSITKRQGTKHPPTCSVDCMSKYRETLFGEKSAWFGRIHGKSAKYKISIANSRPHPEMSGNNNPACRLEVRSKISRTRIDRGVAKGSNNPMFGKTHSPEAIHKIMSHRPMNKLEKLVAVEFDKLGISYTFQFFINDGEICKSYDFKIKDRPIIVEVDGDFWHGNPMTKYHHVDVLETQKNDKIKEEMASKRGYSVIRLWESDIKRDTSIIGRSLSVGQNILK